MAGVAGAFFVVTANAWMNQPRGFDLVNGEVVEADPWAAMFNPATPPQSVHMLLAAFMVTGFAGQRVRGGMLRGRRDRYHRLGFLLPFTVAAVITPVQIGVGDWAAHFVADNQPVKFAAMEGLYETERGAPLHIGGIFVDGEMRYAIEIPTACRCSALGPGRRDHRAGRGAARGPAAGQHGAPVLPDRWSGSASALLGLAAWFGLAWRRRRDLPRHSGSCAPRRVRRRGGGGAGGRLDRHRGRPAALDRLRDPCAPRTRSTPRPACGRLLAVLVVYASHRADRVRAAPAGPRHAGAGRAAGADAAGARRGACDGGAVTLADAAARVLWIGLTAYALFGGADFGAGSGTCWPAGRSAAAAARA